MVLLIFLKICGSPLIFQINSPCVILWSRLCISLHHYMPYFLMQNIFRKTYFSVLVLCFLSLRLEDGSQYVFAASSKELQLVWMKKLQNCPESASSDSDDSGWALTHGWSILMDLRESSQTQSVCDFWIISDYSVQLENVKCLRLSKKNKNKSCVSQGCKWELKELKGKKFTKRSWVENLNYRFVSLEIVVMIMHF